MRVGIPFDVQDLGHRLALTPPGGHELVSAGHDVVVETRAGAASSLPDSDFVGSGHTPLAEAPPEAAPR